MSVLHWMQSYTGDCQKRRDSIQLVIIWAWVVKIIWVWTVKMTPDFWLWETGSMGEAFYRHILNAKTSQDGKSFIWLAFHLSEDTSKGHIKKKRTTNILNYDWLLNIFHVLFLFFCLFLLTCFCKEKNNMFHRCLY